MALLGAHRLRAIDQPSRSDALATSRPSVEQPKPLGATAAPRANKHRPKAAVPEAPQPDADLAVLAVGPGREFDFFVRVAHGGQRVGSDHGP
jgi:hypothetical protein